MENREYPNSARPDTKRSRVRSVIQEYLRRRDAGESISVQQVLAAHPDLMPELGEELKKLHLIQEAGDEAADQEPAPSTADFTLPDTGRVASPAGKEASSLGQGLQVRCPHCQHPVTALPGQPLTGVTCDHCGHSFSLVDDRTDTRHAAAARRVGHFDLIEPLGTGTFGVVWKARDTELDRTVAVKIPRKGQLDALEAEQFLREARAAAQLRHPNIVPVHEVGRDGDTLYIVTGIVRGVTLSDWLGRQRPAQREAAELARKIAQALDHAHQAGVVHRDLKPGNIMIDLEGEPHITDFGLAKRDVGAVTVTVEGKVLGTPAYMSPEQARGESHRADRRSDIYSLGVILYELLTGRLPFRGSRQMLTLQILTEEPVAPRKRDRTISRDMQTICLKCLEKNPDRRYPSAKELADDLGRYLDGQPIRARPVSRLEYAWRWCRRNPLAAGLGLFAVLLVAVIAVLATAVHHLQSRLPAGGTPDTGEQEDESEKPPRQATDPRGQRPVAPIPARAPEKPPRQATDPRELWGGSPDLTIDLADPDLYDAIWQHTKRMRSDHFQKLLYTEILTTMERDQYGEWRIGAGMTSDGRPRLFTVQTGAWFLKILSEEEAAEMGLGPQSMARSLSETWKFPVRQLVTLEDPQIRVVDNPDGSRTLTGRIRCLPDSPTPVTFLTLDFQIPVPGEDASRDYYQPIYSNDLSSDWIEVSRVVDRDVDLSFGVRVFLYAFVPRPDARFYRISNELMCMVGQ